jgi:hypothetical protein
VGAQLVGSGISDVNVISDGSPPHDDAPTGPDALAEPEPYDTWSPLR